jgi:hypothetical protein
MSASYVVYLAERRVRMELLKTAPGAKPVQFGDPLCNAIVPPLAR